MGEAAGLGGGVKHLQLVPIHDDAARSGGNDNYLEGLAKATSNRYEPHSGFGAPTVTSTIKVTNGVL